MEIVTLLHVGNSRPRNDRAHPADTAALRRRFPGSWPVARAIGLLAALLLGFAPIPASAAVELTFYSKELGASFPHAFVTMHGSLDRSGQRIDVDYGFTAKAVSPAILFGKVTGEVISDHGAAYIRGSDKHFSLMLDDPDYDRVIGTVERWRKLPQPSYDLNHRNCVHFVASIAEALGMKVDTSRFIKKPRSFLEALTEANRPWLASRKAHFYRDVSQAAPAARP
ncbi:MAG: hypothetical protein JWP15_3022 [Alphaproteobacteria bacterium]|nr:hypothetical protein [Alphaproteobacteria bacterium]